MAALGLCIVLLCGLLTSGTHGRAAAAGGTPRTAHKDATGKGDWQTHTGDDDNVGRLLAFLDGVSALGAELKASGDAWLRGKAAQVDAAAAQLRSMAAPAGQRLREALRERCSRPAFVPPTDMPAMITGPGWSYSLRSGGCQLRREAAPLRRDLVLTCTDPGVTVTRTVPRYTSAFTSGAVFTGTECKTQYQYGAAATVTVDLWQPGEGPEDVARRWRQRADRWRSGGGRKLTAEAEQGGARRTQVAEAEQEPLRLLVGMHEAPAAAMHAALSRHQAAITTALAAWATEQQQQLHQQDPGGGGAIGNATSAVAESMAALLRDMDMEDAAQQVERQLGYSTEPGATDEQQKRSQQLRRGQQPQGQQRQGVQHQQTAGGYKADVGVVGGEEDPGGIASLLLGTDPLWERATNVSHLFELVGEAGLRAMATAALSRQAEADAEAQVLGVAEPDPLGDAVSDGHVDAAADKSGQTPRNHTEQQQQQKEEEEGEGEEQQQQHCEAGDDIMRALAVEIERLLQL